MSAAVADAAERQEDTELTFARVVDLADAAAGCASKRPSAITCEPNRRRPPRLTEPWFC